MSATVNDCVLGLLNQGVITRKQADDLLNEQDAAVQAGVPDPARVAIENARASLTRQKYLAALQAQVISDLLNKAQTHPEGIAAGIQAILANDLTTKARYSNVDRRSVAIHQLFTSQIAEALNAMRTTHVGLHQDRALVDNVVRELFGKSSGNADAARFAKAIGDTFEAARVRFNEAGGDIPKRDDWGLPQQHNAARVQKAGLDVWKAEILPKLDPKKMIGQNGLPLTVAELDKALDAAFETISTSGLNNLVPGAVAGKKLANQHQDHRFLVFKDADSWLEYDRKFGGGNPFFTMMSHLENMAHDIGLLEIMGPNPTQAMRVLRDTARKQGVEGMPLARMDAVWESVSGAGNGTATLKMSTVENLAAVRNLLSSAMLGSAILSAPSDLAFMRHAAAWNGLSQTRAIASFLSMLNPANAADRMRAVQAGLIAEAWIGVATSANRYGEVTGTGLSARAADLTIRASGLSHWTDAAQKAIGMEFLTRTAELRGLRWADVPAENRALLESTGFDEADWNILRKAPVEEHNGVSRIDLPALLRNESIPKDARQRVVNRTMESIISLTHQAIPSPDAQTRSIGAMAGSRGTITRELSNFVLQFKSFPMAVIQSHLYRGINQGSMADKGAYMASLAVATTVMGMLSMQLKEISKGQTPREMDTPEAWGAAFLQGGGAGVFGDFVQSGMFGSNRFGGSLFGTMAGPGAGLATDIARLTAGQFGEVIEGKDTNMATDAISAARRYTPVVGSLWYTRLAYERLVLNQLQLQADPDARQRFRQETRRKSKEHGNRYWWKKGELAPE